MNSTDGAVEHAAETLRQWMGSGRLAPGQRLVEPDLTAALAVSRTTLRAAFRTLASEGLVIIEQYRGASVKRLSREQIEEVFEAREVLEGLAARKAATRLHGTPSLTRLGRLMAEMRRAASQTGLEAQYTRLNTEFHSVIVTAAQSDYLATLIRQTAVPNAIQTEYTQAEVSIWLPYSTTQATSPKSRPTASRCSCTLVGPKLVCQ